MANNALNDKTKEKKPKKQGKASKTKGPKSKNVKRSRGQGSK